MEQQQKDRRGTLAYIGIGSNLGDALAHVEHALDALNGLQETRLVAKSSLFQTAPVDASGNDYVNVVASVFTSLSADSLLQALLHLEKNAGRERPYPNAPRTLDLDVLLYGKQIISTPSLTVPHPRMTSRAFVLLPMLQIDPFIDIPGKGPAHHFVSNVADQPIHKIT